MLATATAPPGDHGNKKKQKKTPMLKVITYTQYIMGHVNKNKNVFVPPHLEVRATGKACLLGCLSLHTLPQPTRLFLRLFFGDRGSRCSREECPVFFWFFFC